MNDRTSSMAQLSRWTEAMKNDTGKVAVADSKQSVAPMPSSRGAPAAKPPAIQEQKKSKPTVDEEYEEEFEDYEEDFEEDSSPAKPSNKTTNQQPSLAPPKPVQSSFSSTPTLDLKSVHNERNDRSSPLTAGTGLDMKKIQREREDQVPKTARRSLEGMTTSLARSIADPRSMRVQRIMNSKVLELQSEKFTLLTLLPSTPYEFYNNILRKPNTHIKQIGVPMDQETREIEINTEEILMKDEIVQASFEDDTKFYNILEDVANKGKKLRNHAMKDVIDIDSLRINQGNTVVVTAESKEGGQGSLSTFLQRASGVVEGLLNSERSAKDVDSKFTASKSSQSSILDATVISFGSDKSKGENELIRMRSTTFVKFSVVQSHMLLSVHPYPLEENENDLMAEKALVGIWDLVTSTAAPVYILESTSQITCASFSSTQTYIIVAGTWDGSIHLWDLREASALHQDRDSQDLKISRGIRKPTFSSHPSLSLDEFGASDTQTSHASAIMQIEPIGDSANSSVAVSQFLSVDEHGLMIFWMTTEVSHSGQLDLKKSPWGRVTLTPTKTLSLQTTSMVPQIVCGVLDANSLLIGGWKGEVRRIMRMGEVTGPKSYFSMNADNSHVSCMDIKQNSIMDNNPLILLGRDSGVVDLYEVSKAFPIASWNIAALDKNSKLVRIIAVKWILESSFIAVTNKGLLVYFNLLQDLYHPAHTESIGVRNLMRGEVDVSTLRDRLDVCRLITCKGKELKLSLMGRRIVPNLSTYNKDENANLREALNHFIVSSVAENKNMFSNHDSAENFDGK